MPDYAVGFSDLLGGGHSRRTSAGRIVSELAPEHRS